eukprot:4414424-Amphidinium_carterae.1
MATEHCIAAFVDFYQVRVLVMHKEHQAAWVYIPAGETMAGPCMLVWLHQQHFQSGPTFDLAQINHAISSNVDEQAFKSFCLRGGRGTGSWEWTAEQQKRPTHTASSTSSSTPLQQREQSCRYGACNVPIAFLADLSLDFMHRWEQRLKLVAATLVAPACVLAGDSMALNLMMLAGDSTAMTCIMLITSDLCRQ